MRQELELKKYPRTPHIEGSRLQVGDEDLSQIRFREIVGRHVVVEEKIDGANTAISFSADGKLLLQSRGHYLTGGYRERHYDLMKQWANSHRDSLYNVLGSRYIMYGEWMYAKHSVFYDALPHYFFEFDIFDREKQIYLDTPSRRKLTEQMPIVSVPVLAEGEFKNMDQLLQYLKQSLYITDRHMEVLRRISDEMGLDADRQCRETDSSTTMEGLYLKIEEKGQVVDRMKFVRPSFSQCVETSETHWLERPIIPNQLSVPLERLFE